MQIIRWQATLPPDANVLRKNMQDEGLSPYTWSNAPGDFYAAHTHSYQKVLYCVRGSIRFILPDELNAAGSASYIDLAPGDCLLLPPGVRHSAQVGTRGVTCLEAARYLALQTPEAIPYC